uniref:Uncharacterized protein n=1 Tax=Alexandrium monilatum TaxID=311494 RepID=A0A7S4STS9_9DINO
MAQVWAADWAARPMSATAGASAGAAARASWRRVSRPCAPSSGGGLRLACGAARRVGGAMAPWSMLAALSVARRRRRRADRLAAVSRAARPRESAAAEAAKEFEPVAEYRALKDDMLSSWGFLGDQDFAIRALAVFIAGLVPGISFGAAVFPLRSEETGELLVRNTVAASLLGAFLALCLLLAVIYRLAGQWDSVNKLLQRRAYYVEYDPTKKMDYGSGSGGAYSFKQAKSEKEMERDRLLAEYETEPAVSRLRVYLLGTLAAAGSAIAGSLSVGGEIGLAREEEEEEEEDEVSAMFYKGKKTVCKEGCIPGLEKD